MRDTLRHLLVGLVVLTMVTSAFAGFVGGVAATTHVVDASGGGDFTTIQAAVDAASPGDTIQIRPGTYDGGVIVDKSLTIVGDPGDATAGSGPDAPVLQNASGMVGFEVRAGATDTTIRGLEFRDYRDAAVSVVVVNGATLSGFTFEQNTVSNAEFEVEFGGVGNGELAGMTVARNRFIDRGRFEIDENNADRVTMTDVDVSENVFVGSQSDSIDVDLYLPNVDVTMTVRGNTILDAEGDGIEFELHPDGTYDITIEDNVVDNAGHEGIEFLTNGGADLVVRIVNNELLNNHGNAIQLHDGDATGFTVSGNTIDGNTGGIVNGGSGVLDARDNYWGSSDGPSEEQLADESVDVTPYATEPTAEPESSASASGGARFDLGDASVSTANPVVGQDVTISVPVTNEGDGAGTLRGMFRSDFTGHDSVDVRIGAGETVVVRTTVRYGDAGSYNLYLDDEYVGDLQVSARDPMRVSVTADPANDTVDATVENPRRTAIDIPMEAVNASHDSGVVLTNVQVTPAGIDDFTLSVSQSTYLTDAASGDSLAAAAENETEAASVNATAAANATDAVMLLPDGSAPVSGFAFDSSLSNDRIESVVLTVTVDTTRYPSLADADVGDTVSLYRHDAATGTYVQQSAEVVETANGSLTATVTLDGFSTYLLGVDRGAYAVSGSLDGSPAVAGDSVSLVLGVTNTGDGAGRYSPEVAIAGTPVAADGVTLGAGESGTLVVEVPASAPGAWPITVGDRLVAIVFVEPALDDD